jgi:hypothetical protein
MFGFLCAMSCLWDGYCLVKVKFDRSGIGVWTADVLDLHLVTSTRA